MVTPREILELAEELATRQTEVAVRSAISRAYYAAFWHCRAFVEEQMGPLDVPGADVHMELASTLRHFDPAAADSLSLMRRARNRADYDSTASFAPSNALAHLSTAQELLELR